MNLCLEYDDLHWKSPENCLEHIENLVNMFPDIKLSFFTVPMLRGNPLNLDQEWCKKIRDYIDSDNICLGLHGFIHSQEEFKNISYGEAKAKISTASIIFERCGFPKPIAFRGPHWGINETTYRVLIDQNYKFVYTHEDYKHLILKYPEIKSVIYNQNLKDPIMPKQNIIAHGHTHNVCSNGIQETKDKVVKFCKTYKPNFININKIS
jgi:predicted deacetylase